MALTSPTKHATISSLEAGVFCLPPLEDSRFTPVPSLLYLRSEYAPSPQDGPDTQCTSCECWCLKQTLGSAGTGYQISQQNTMHARRKQSPASLLRTASTLLVCFLFYVPLQPWLGRPACPAVVSPFFSIFSALIGWADGEGLGQDGMILKAGAVQTLEALALPFSKMVP